MRVGEIITRVRAVRNAKRVMISRDNICSDYHPTERLSRLIAINSKLMRTCWSLLSNTELHVQEQSASSMHAERAKTREWYNTWLHFAVIIEREVILARRSICLLISRTWITGDYTNTRNTYAWILIIHLTADLHPARQRSSILYRERRAHYKFQRF